MTVAGADGSSGEPVRRCDSPGCSTKGVSVREFEVTYPGEGRLVVDLCRSHAKVLNDFRQAMKVSLRPLRRPLPRGHSTTPVDPGNMPDDL